LLTYWFPFAAKTAAQMLLLEICSCSGVDVLLLLNLAAV
jgi:hypothetical protein